MVPLNCSLPERSEGGAAGWNLLQEFDGAGNAPTDPCFADTSFYRRAAQTIRCSRWLEKVRYSNGPGYLLK